MNLEEALGADKPEDIIVYRGVGKNTGKTTYGKGMYVTTNKDFAGRYGDVKEYRLSDGNFLTVGVELPLPDEVIDAIAEAHHEYADAMTWSKVPTYSDTALNIREIIRTKRPMLSTRESYDAAKEDINDALKDLGYSGIEYPADQAKQLGASEIIEGKAFVVFDPSVLKATNTK